MNQNKITNPYFRAFFLLLIITFSACKKDDKDTQLSGYELKVISGNNRTEQSNRQTSDPLVVAIVKNGIQLGRNELYPYTVSVNNSVCGSEELSDYDVNIQADGTIHLYWFTGETEGTQHVVVSLNDEAGAKLAQTEATLTTTLNTDGWHAACQKPNEAILAAAGNSFLMFTQEEGWNSTDGKEWNKWGQPPPGLDFYGGYNNNYRPKLIYYENILYAMFMNHFYPDGLALYRSADMGKTWEAEYSYPKDTRLLAVIDEETVIISFPDGLGARVYKNGKYEKSEALIKAGGFVDFVMNGTIAFALDQFGGLYRATGYNEQYVLVNEALKLEKVLVKNNVLYGFSGNKAYHSADNGTTFTFLADIPQQDLSYNKVNDVLVAGNQFYIIQAKEPPLFSMNNWVVSTSDWATFSDYFLVRKNYYNPTNFCVKNDGTVLVQKDNQSLLYKKP